jgi:putative transposase
MIGLPRSTYYRRPRLGTVDHGDAELLAAIEAVRKRYPAYGYRRVTHELRRRGHRINHKRVQRVMQEALAPPSRRRRPPVVPEQLAEGRSVYPDLRADFEPTGPDQLWVADLTYVRVAMRFVFLAVLLDAWSRKVIGYAFAPVLDARLPLAALEAALDSRRPPPGCIHHSDRGAQYASRRYRECLEAAGLRGSMSRAGNPYDNAQVESFMKTFKHEEALLTPYESMDDLLTRLPYYLETIYNGYRLHSALGYLPPDEFEALHAARFASVKVLAG